MELARVVARYSDGRVAKGSTENFYPHKDSFDLFTADKPSGEAIKIFIKELKAVFFVRDFIGNPAYNERKDYIEGEKPSGSKVKVTFVDNEVLVGSNYNANRYGFFFSPTDPNSNNMRVFAVSSAVKRGCFL
jgi:hypothetical protein